MANQASVSFNTESHPVSSSVTASTTVINDHCATRPRVVDLVDTADASSQRKVGTLFDSQVNGMHDETQTEPLDSATYQTPQDLYDPVQKYPRQNVHSRFQGSRCETNLFTLPMEILVMIFDKCHHMDLPLIPLMTVCRTFNEVIKGAPRLWRRILISLGAIPPSLKAGRTMVCSTESFLKTCINRARGSPLEVTFVVGGRDRSSPPAEVRRSRFKVFMSFSENISSLGLTIEPYTSLQVVKDSFLDLFNPSTSFPEISSLVIVSSDLQLALLDVLRPLLDQLERTSTKLKSVSFHEVNQDFILAAREYKFWRRLNSITIHGDDSPLHATAFEGCIDLQSLTMSNELVTHSSSALQPPLRNGLLGISDEIDSDATEGSGSTYLPVHPQRKVVLTKLLSLEIGAVAIHSLQELQAHNLESLVIHSALPQDERQPPLAPHSIHLPSLQVLHVRAWNSEVNSISAPLLRSLSLEISSLERQDADSAVLGIFHGKEGMWTPKSLNINARIHENHYKTLYKRLPTVERLAITLPGKPSEIFYNAIKKRGILQNLISLTVVFPRRPVPSHTNEGPNEDPSSTSAAPSTRIVRYLPLHEHTLTSGNQSQRSGRDTVLNPIIGGINRFETDEGGLIGGDLTQLCLSERVRPSMCEVARVRAQQGLEFSFLCCKYSDEHLEEIYAENNICNGCRRSAYLSRSLAPTDNPANIKVNLGGQTRVVPVGDDHLPTVNRY